jgi:hypothetical protein
MDPPGDRKLLLFDQETQKWSELMSNKNPGLNWNQWSDDSKSVYVFRLRGSARSGRLSYSYR